jgi:MFS family permease
MAQLIVEPCSRGLITTQPCPRELGRKISLRRRRIVLAGCVLASSMAFIDGSALTVALPKLRTALGADLASVQWVLNGYMLALASLTLVGGGLADVHGKSRMLSIGCILFGAASAGCSLAPSAGWLVAARVLQGVAAALMTPASLALIGATYPKDERNRAIAVWAAASALTTAAGPVLGGWLTETFGWQAVFWINPPLALIGVVLLRNFAPEDQFERRRFDIFGASIIAASLGALAWALSQTGRSYPRSASMRDAMIMLVGGLGAIGLGAYAAWERVSDHPMTPPRLAQNRVFLGLNVATLLVYAGCRSIAAADWRRPRPGWRFCRSPGPRQHNATAQLRASSLISSSSSFSPSPSHRTACSDRSLHRSCTSCSCRALRTACSGRSLRRSCISRRPERSTQLFP